MALRSGFGGAFRFFRRVHGLDDAGPALGFALDEAGEILRAAAGGIAVSYTHLTLPTIGEDALPGYVAGLWFGILGPAGLPKPVIDKVSAATNAALKDPQLLHELQSQGLNAAGGSPKDFARFIKSETERWARVIKSMDAAKKAESPAKP